MRFFRLLAIIAALGMYSALPSVSTATESYTAYVACGYRTTKPPATSCPKSGRIGAFFQSNDATVTFKTCVTFPNGQRLCTGRATAEQGAIYVAKMKPVSKGKLTVRWKVNGVVVAKYSIRVT